MDLGAMAMKEYFVLSKDPVLLSLALRLFSLISGHSLGEPYSPAEMQLVYSTTPADLASNNRCLIELFVMHSNT